MTIKRYTNTIPKAGLAVYGAWFALIVDTDGYEGKLYPETKQPACKMIWAWIKQRDSRRTRQPADT